MLYNHNPLINVAIVIIIIFCKQKVLHVLGEDNKNNKDGH